MSRPIIWALGVMAACGSVFGLAAPFFAQRYGGAEPAPAVSAEAGKALVTIAADLKGHFTVHPSVDGVRLRMLVDTGASIIALTHEDARKLGLDLSPARFTARVETANGTVAVAPMRLREVRIGDIVVRNVEASVLPEGKLGTSLLGMSYLRRIGGFEISSGRLTLRS